MKLRETISHLKGIVGAENVLTGIHDRISHAVDRGKKYQPLERSKIPVAVVRPIDACEVSAILKFANKERVPVYIRGAGTGILAAIMPKKAKAIILDLERMRNIDIFENDNYVEVGPAVTIKQLNESLALYGYHFPTFIGGWKIASLGGIISINTSGHSVDSNLGKPRHYILGLQVVLPTGEIIETGSRTPRLPSGPDLTHLFIGGEGLFGVITKIRIRFIRKPLEEKYALVVFKSSYDAGLAAVKMFHESPAFPCLLELLDAKLSKAIYEKNDLKLPEGALLMMITDGMTEGEALWKLNRILEVFKKEKVLAIKVLKDKGGWKRIWDSREVISDLVPGPYVSEVFDPPVSRIPETIKEAEALIDKFHSLYGVAGFVLSHLGGVTICTHIKLPTNINSKQRRKIAREIKKEAIKISSKIGASRGEQGIFPVNKGWFLAHYGEAYFQLLRSIKRTLDPNDILNPGNLEAPALR